MIIETTARTIVVDSPSPWRTAERRIGEWVARYDVERTRTAYLHHVKSWLRFLQDLGIADPIHEVRSSHFELMMRQMEANGRAKATIAGRFGAVFLWYEWLVNEEYLDRSQARKVRRPKVPNVSTTPWLPRRQLADLLDAAERLGGYDAATVVILGLLALRVSELCSLDVEGVTDVKYHRVINFVGKGNKPAIMPLPPRAVYALANALNGRTTGPLILTRTGTRATRDSVGRTIRRAMNEAGLAGRISPHGMRHSAITAALDSGVPMRDVQLFARHAKSDTTSRYDRHRDNLDRNASYTLSQALAS